VEDLEIVSNCAGGDEAIDRGANRQARPPREPEQIRGLLDDRKAEGRFDNRKRAQAVTGDPERALIRKTLENLLDHGETCDDFVERDQRFQVQWAVLSKDFYPNGCVDEDQRDPPRPRRGGSRRISVRSPVQRPDPVRLKI
jgi:hypothetical protein